MTETTAVNFQDYSIRGLGRINVLLGKNGSGKSTVLKALERFATDASDPWSETKYITPERAGVLVFDANVDQTIAGNPTWMGQVRRENQFIQFKQQTISQYRQLQLSVLLAVEESAKAKQEPKMFFSDYLERINDLLDNIEIRSESTGGSFKMYDRESGAEIQPKDISSGESELIALAIEALVFVQTVSADSRGLLLLDEPDVHLHPDLQSRLVKFLVKLIDEFDFDILMATHSTSILGELAESSAANVCLMAARQKDLTFEPVDDIYKQLLPVFGAHPLTRVFSESPTLLVEGEDDVRIWQQAVRSANGALKIYPVECGGLPYMAKYEDRLARVMNAVYDGATAYSLRDRDDSEISINDIPPVVRMRLSCRSAENLLLSDDVISLVDLTWEVVQSRINEWFNSNSEKPHPKFDAMKSFVEQGMPRKSADLKELRMILVGQILASNKPWEVLVGQAIGNTPGAPAVSATDEPDSIRAYLGMKLFDDYLPASHGCL